MLREERTHQLLMYLHDRGAGRLSTLSDLFGVSTSTIRRDVAELESRHLVRRVYGGVVHVDTATHQEDRRVTSDGNNTDTERRIAHAAATLVQDGSTIVIAGNALAEAMIPALARKEGITVITNALNVARRLCVHPDMSGIVLGGWLRRPDCAMVGHLAAQALVDLRADMAFYGPSGIDIEHGVTSLRCQDILTDRQLMGIARTVCILADQHAVGRWEPVRVLPLDAVSTIVTDYAGSECIVERLRHRGMMVINTVDAVAS